MSITPEQVAQALTAGDNDYDESLNGWPSLRAESNVVEIRVTPVREDGIGDAKNAQDFRAVVVEDDRPPIILPRPEHPGSMIANDRKPILALERLGNLPPMIVMWPGGANENLMSPDIARQLAAHLAALADQAEGKGEHQ